MRGIRSLTNRHILYFDIISGHVDCQHENWLRCPRIALGYPVYETGKITRPSARKKAMYLVTFLIPLAIQECFNHANGDQDQNQEANQYQDWGQDQPPRPVNVVRQLEADEQDRQQSTKANAARPCVVIFTHQNASCFLRTHLLSTRYTPDITISTCSGSTSD